MSSKRLADAFEAAEAVNIQPQQKDLFLYRGYTRCIQSAERWK